MEELQNICLTDQAISLVAPRKSGKTHLLTHMLLKTLEVDNDASTHFNIIVFCQSLVDANTYYHLYVHVMLDALQLTLNERGHQLVDKFEIREHMSNIAKHSLTTIESDDVIKKILRQFIQYLMFDAQVTVPSQNRRFNSCTFFFNGNISSTIMNKLITPTHKSERRRKYIIIIDDVRDEKYKLIKSDILYIYEQGRHHDLSVIVVDQYIKSSKVPPRVRLTSSYLMFRDFDDNIRKEICQICSLDKNQLDIDNIRNLINQYYAIIINFSNKTRLFYMKAPEKIFNSTIQIPNSHE